LLTVKIPNFTYHRVLATCVTNELTQELKKVDYSFVVSYGEFLDNEYEIIHKHSCIINLARDIGEVLAAFNPTSRNEVRRADKINGLTFHHSLNDFNFDTYYAFYKSCERDRNWYPVPEEELRQSLVFSAAYNGTLIAGMSCYSHGDRIRVGRIYSNKRSMLSDSLTNLIYGVASKRIVFEICKYGIAQQFTALDLGGVDLNTTEKSGITKFKLSMGGEVIPVKIGRWCKTSYEQLQQEFLTQGLDLT
jgi:lipid II:glycine glycyltransferase (peptidoglycan interpeptide bridge formation enzyme)